VHVLPAAQEVHPVQPVPAHCPYFALEQPEVEVVDEVVAVVVWDVVVLVVVVVVDDVDEEVETGVVVLVVAVVVDDVVPVVLHPTRVEEMEMSSYQNVLASLPYDSQPK